MADPKWLTSLIGFITDHSDPNILWQFVNKIRPDVLWIGGLCGGAIDHKQYAIGLADLFPRALNTNFFYRIRSVS